MEQEGFETSFATCYGNDCKIQFDSQGTLLFIFTHHLLVDHYGNCQTNILGSSQSAHATIDYDLSKIVGIAKF